MRFEDDAAFSRLASGLQDRTLPKREWDHAGHFAAALWLLRTRRELTAPEGMRALISAYNEATGVENTDTGGYHHTITRASVWAAEHWLGLHEADAPLRAVHEGLMASPFGDPGWLLSYWRRDTLFDVAARREWVEPDLGPLPFRGGGDPGHGVRSGPITRRRG